MHLQTLSVLAFSFTLPLLATAYPANAPSPAAPAAKAHNIYLVTCVPRPRKDDDDNTPPPTNPQNFTAIAYFKQPLNATEEAASDKPPKPDKAALVSQPPEPWEGVKWRVKVWKDKLFSASIDTGAAVQAKGVLAGSATLGEEPYVCFRDGQTAIRVREDELRGDCVADYWCAGLGKPDDTGSGGS